MNRTIGDGPDLVEGEVLPKDTFSAIAPEGRVLKHLLDVRHAEKGNVYANDLSMHVCPFPECGLCLYMLPSCMCVLWLQALLHVLHA